MDPDASAPRTQFQPAANRFAPTRWSLVQAAGAQESLAARSALEELCRAYWPPVYAEIRRRGHAAADAQDLTQSFFARLLKSQAFGRADKEKGRFRSYLLAALDFFLANHLRDAHTAKRGGGVPVLSLDDEEAECWVQQQAGRDLTPAQAYDRHWAMALMNRAFESLRDTYARTGREEVFSGLQPFLAAESGANGYEEVAARLGLSESAFAVAVHRFRQRFRDCLREQVEMTVTDPADAAEEMQHLFGM